MSSTGGSATSADKANRATIVVQVRPCAAMGRLTRRMDAASTLAPLATAANVLRNWGRRGDRGSRYSERGARRHGKTRRGAGASLLRSRIKRQIVALPQPHPNEGRPSIGGPARKSHGRRRRPARRQQVERNHGQNDRTDQDAYAFAPFAPEPVPRCLIEVEATRGCFMDHPTSHEPR